jgi:hypothetical protein
MINNLRYDRAVGAGSTPTAAMSLAVPTRAARTATSATTSAATIRARWFGTSEGSQGTFSSLNGMG